MLSKKTLMKTTVIIATIIAGFAGFVAIKTRKDKHMTVRQKILKTMYPLIMWGSGSKNQVLINRDQKEPVTSFFDLSIHLTDGSLLDTKSLQGKKILLVNTASDCGYTAQYESLEKLYQAHSDSLIIIAFPANDFKEQEKGTDQEIAGFCKKNYGVTFPIAAKGVVIKNNDQQEMYRWLTDKNKNGWNEQPPTWNFCKYLIDEHGMLVGFFSSGVKPEVVWSERVKMSK